MEVLLSNTMSRQAILRKYFSMNNIIEIDSAKELLIDNADQTTLPIGEENDHQLPEQRLSRQSSVGLI